VSGVEEPSEEQRRLAQVIQESYSDRAPGLIAARDTIRDARLRAEWEAKVKALAEEWEKLAALHHEWENRARVDCRYDDADAHDKHAGAMLMRIRELRALLAAQPEQQPGTEDGGAGE
jgi:hypothetical protein